MIDNDTRSLSFECGKNVEMTVFEQFSGRWLSSDRGSLEAGAAAARCQVRKAFDGGAFRIFLSSGFFLLVWYQKKF